MSGQDERMDAAPHPAPACAEPASPEAHLDEALRRAFWQSLNRAPLPALAALEVAASRTSVRGRPTDSRAWRPPT